MAKKKSMLLRQGPKASKKGSANTVSDNNRVRGGCSHYCTFKLLFNFLNCHSQLPAKVDDAVYGGPLQPAIRVDDPVIVAAIGPLAGPHSSWKAADVERAIPALKRRIGFIAGGCSPPASVAWQVFVSKWVAYLDEHPRVKHLVDPDFVAFDFVGGAIPAAFANDVATSDVRIGVAPTMRANNTPSTSLFALAGLAPIWRMRSWDE